MSNLGIYNTIIGYGVPYNAAVDEGMVRVGSGNVYLEIDTKAETARIVGGTPDEAVEAFLSALALVYNTFARKHGALPAIDVET